MSQFPNMDQPGSAPNPFAAPPPGYAPPKRSSAWLWILLGCGGVSALVCCGCGGFIYFAMNTGFKVMEQELAKRLKDEPAIQEHLGEVESVTFDFWASTKESQDRGKVFVFHVKGSKGNGDVLGKQPEPGGQMIRDAKLVLPDGNEVDLSF